jgi:hypothetical protein
MATKKKKNKKKATKKTAKKATKKAAKKLKAKATKKVPKKLKAKATKKTTKAAKATKKTATKIVAKPKAIAKKADKPRVPSLAEIAADKNPKRPVSNPFRAEGKPAIGGDAGHNAGTVGFSEAGEDLDAADDFTDPEVEQFDDLDDDDEEKSHGEDEEGYF